MLVTLSTLKTKSLSKHHNLTSNQDGLQITELFTNTTITITMH